jgi:uncharacterized protein YcfL
MKKTIAALALIVLVGCGESRNQLMTKLVNERKALKDSMAITNDQSKVFTNKALYDSAILCLEKMEPQEKRLKAIDFSIDSLSKMK